MLPGNEFIIVDDTASIRSFLRISLTALGASVREAATGEDALRLFDEKPADILILDLGLPDIDGMTVLERLNAQYGRGACRVIVLTVRKELADRRKAEQEGASAYITKPFMMEDLLDVLLESRD